MPVLNEDGAADDDSDSRQRCSCLPAFCLWGTNKSGSAQAKRRRRRRSLRFRFRFRLRLSRLSWLAWPWFRKSGDGNGDAGDDGDGGSSKEGKKRRMRGGRRLLLLLTTSLQPKKALASVVSGDSSGLLPVPPKVGSFGGDDKKQNNRRRPPPRPTADDAASGSNRQPQASATAATASATAPRSRPETTTSQAPSPRPTDGPGASGRRTWRAPSRRHPLHRPGDEDCSSSSGLWTAATTLGVIVLLGRVAAVVFLCSCLYGARFVRAWAAGGAGAIAKVQSSGGVSGVTVSSSSRRFGDPVGVAAGDKVTVAEMCGTEERKKVVVMAGLLDRAGKTPSSRFGR